MVAGALLVRVGEAASGMLSALVGWVFEVVGRGTGALAGWVLEVAGATCCRFLEGAGCVLELSLPANETWRATTRKWRNWQTR